jgi:hypothetical protein
VRPCGPCIYALLDRGVQAYEISTGKMMIVE